MDYSLRYHFRLKECMDRAGYGVYLFERRGESLYLAKPFHIEMERLSTDGAPAYFGDREASFYLPLDMVKKDKIVDSIYEALVDAGLRQSDKELAGEHRATLKQLEREKQLHDRTLGLMERIAQ